MRKIDWEAPLSTEDVAWIRQAGFMSEERIAAHQGQFDAEVPDPETPDDNLTKDALDGSVRTASPVPGTGAGSPVLADPTGADEADDEDEDVEDEDYSSWSVEDLRAEVAARDAMESTTNVEVEGTGKDHKVLKADLVKGLQLWDQENPNAFKN